MLEGPGLPFLLLSKLSFRIPMGEGDHMWRGIVGEENVASNQLLNMVSMGQPLNSGRIDTQDASQNLTHPSRSSALEPTPSKHFLFHSFHNTQITTWKQTFRTTWLPQTWAHPQSPSQKQTRQRTRHHPTTIRSSKDGIPKSLSYMAGFEEMIHWFSII